MGNWVRKIIRKLNAKEIPLYCQKEGTPKQNFELFQNSGIITGALRNLNKILAITFSPVVLGFNSDH